MKVLWCDTETTGLNPENSGAFQIAMLYKYGADKTKVWSRLFFLNPLDDGKGIIYHEEAAKTHNVSRSEIEKFDKAEIVMPKIATENKRLGTVCKSIGVSLENAHDALGDITATRDLGVTLQRMGVPLIM